MLHRLHRLRVLCCKSTETLVLPTRADTSCFSMLLAGKATRTADRSQIVLLCLSEAAPWRAITSTSLQDFSQELWRFGAEDQRV